MGKGTTDIVASMNNVFNAKDLFADYEELNKQANDLGFKLVVGIKDNATIKGSLTIMPIEHSLTTSLNMRVTT